MRVIIYLLFAAASAQADQIRRTKLPYIADAVGNSLPPPSSGPASVGSPVKLLSPDKYEFYTFDESGELVKRLMTLEEIQAIVAAGEETDGLVTFANDNLPTITFNFSQPSQTKVHNVVTNVQNVLKAQMEAHKNKPYVQPTLDTPDVSDSWSLILPSIFGNTGVDIVPDKLSGSFITPETETIEINNSNNEYDNSQSKESNDIPTVASTALNKEPTNKPSTNIPSTTSGSTSSKTPITTTTTQKTPLTTTTQKPTSTTTTQKPTSTTTTQKSPSTTTTQNPPSTTTTQNPPSTTTKKMTTTTQKPSSTTTTQKITTAKMPLDTKPPYKSKTTTKPLLMLTSTEPPIVLSTVQTSTTIKNNITPPKNMATKLDLQLNQSSYKNKNETKTSSSSINNKPYEDENKYVPVSTVSYITESTTNKVLFNNKHTILSNKIPSEINKISMNITTNMPILIEDKETEKQNSTTITTQSVSPSTSVPSTELISTQKHHTQSNIVPKNPLPTMNSVNDNDDTIIPMFDVAQSLSQIASDLSGNFTPVPTSSSLSDTTPQSNVEIESKESLEIDIPTESTNENEGKENNTDVRDHFIKISTFNPVGNSQTNTSKINAHKNIPVILNLSSTTPTSASNNIDPLLSESMDNLFSQVANEDPDSTTVIISENHNPSDDILITETSLDSTTNNIVNLDTTTEKYPEVTPNLPISDNSEKDKNKKINDHLESPLLSSASTNTKLEKEKDLLLTTLKPEINNNIILETPTPLISSTSKSEVDLTIKPNDNDLTNKITSTTTDKIETTKSTRKNIAVTNIINTTVPPKGFNEHNKISNKQHKISEALPKIEDFKKKIQKVNIDDKELANERNNSWKLIPTVVKLSDLAKDKQKIEGFYTPESNDKDIILEFPKENQGLEVTTKDLGEDIMQFTELSNELAFRYWNIMVEKIDKKRSMVFSPYSITSMLAMMFMGAKGATSGEMNEVLKLDDMVTFNPHFTLKNVSDSIETTSSSGVAVSAFIRELYSERNKGKILTFYKERAQHFYNGHVEEVNFKLISDIIRRRTNLLVKRYTWGKIPEYMKTNSITMNPPLAAFAANIFYTDCSGSSVDGRDGEMYFVVSPSVRQRRLVPVPSVVYRSNFLAGYDPVLDATAAALGNTESIVSTLFLMPGQQGNVVHTDDLENLEKRLIKAEVSTPAWNRLLRTLLPRIGLELQIPRFSHKSIFNVTSTLQRMELKDLFSEDHADLGGLNGPSKDLHLSDMIQQTSFVTCGEDVIGEQHHIEEYPDTIEIRPKRRTSRWNTGWAEPRDYQRAFHDPHDVGEAMHLPLHLRPRQARVPARSSQPARLKFDRPFLYFVRHNPSGMILYVGRYNPRLLP